MGRRSGNSKTKTHIQSKRPTNRRVFTTSEVLPKEQWVTTPHWASSLESCTGKMIPKNI